MNAEEVAAACRAELSGLGSQLSQTHEAESMWEGRAQGLQQQLDQARLEVQHLQHSCSDVTAALAARDNNIRCSHCHVSCMQPMSQLRP